MTIARASRMAAFAAVMAAGGSAWGQQIVGGRALDADLRVGSGGLNSNRASNYSNPALSRPTYSAPTYSQFAPPPASAGLRQPVYSVASQSGEYYSRLPSIYQPNAGILYGTGAAGLAYNPLAAPLYSPLEQPFVIQRGPGGQPGSNINLYRAPDITSGRYRPY